MWTYFPNGSELYLMVILNALTIPVKQGEYFVTMNSTHLLCITPLLNQPSFSWDCRGLPSKSRRWNGLILACLAWPWIRKQGVGEEGIHETPQSLPFSSLQSTILNRWNSNHKGDLVREKKCEDFWFLRMERRFYNWREWFLRMADKMVAEGRLQIMF